jgi:ATP-dependent exoDNAse (exonuclease V) alpha subunit
MLLRNLNIRMGLCNGTRLEVVNMHKHILECKILSGKRQGEIELIPRITLNLAGFYPFVLLRHQFPICLAFSMTINKAQGQTFEFVGIDLRTEVFAHGQLYVSLSRARGWDKVKILLHPDNTNKKVKNIVYNEVLSSNKLFD